jgi:hypothetical protein
LLILVLDVEAKVESLEKTFQETQKASARLSKELSQLVKICK